jgi:hypothetical protein
MLFVTHFSSLFPRTHIEKNAHDSSVARSREERTKI